MNANAPIWYPHYAKPCIDSFIFLEETPPDSIVFIKYPEKLHEEYMPILRGLFHGNGRHFIEYNNDSLSLENIDEDFKEYVKKKSLKAGPTEYSFNIENSRITLVRDKTHTVNAENPSHRVILQSVRAINLMLQENTRVVCFQMNAGCLDANSSEFIYRLFEYMEKRIKNKGKNFIVYYSDDLKYAFSEKYLWTITCCKYFAVITGIIAYKVANAEKAIKNIKESLEKMDYKRIDMFVGAGAGISSGLPSGETLKLKALKELTGNHEEDTPEGLLKKVFDKYPTGLTADKDRINFEMLMSLLQKESHDDLTQTEVLKDFIQKHKNARKNPSKGYNIIKKLVGENNIKILAVTTNFDQLLEDSIPGATTTIKSEEFRSMDSMKIVKDENSNNIVKLHGCLTYPNTLIIKNDYLMRFEESKKIFMKTFLTEVRRSESIANVFFIGYNFADPDVLDVLTENIDSVRIRPLIVNPELSPSVIELMSKFDKVGKASLIPFGFDFFMEIINRLIDENKAAT